VFGEGLKIAFRKLILATVTKPVDTLYEFAQDYDLASYHIKPVSTNTFAIAFQAVVARTRSLEPDTNGLVVVHKNGTVLIEKQYYDDEWVSFCDQIRNFDTFIDT
jgi:hypothetical protein